MKKMRQRLWAIVATFMVLGSSVAGPLAAVASELTTPSIETRSTISDSAEVATVDGQSGEVTTSTSESTPPVEAEDDSSNAEANGETAKANDSPNVTEAQGELPYTTASLSETDALHDQMKDVEALYVIDGVMYYQGEPLYVGGNDEQVPAKYEELLKAGVAQTLTTASSRLGLTRSVNQGQQVTIQFVGYVSATNPYGYTSTVGDFRVDGQQAFCVQHALPTPGTGMTATANVYEVQEVRNALYYGWGGPANIFSDHNVGVVVTSLILDRIISGGTTGQSLPQYNDLWDRVVNGKAPTGDFTPSRYNSDTKIEGDYQISEDFRFTSETSNDDSFSIEIPEGVELVNRTTGNVSGAGSTNVNLNDTFYYRAGLSYQLPYTSNAIGSSKGKYQPIVAVVGGGYQAIGFGQWVKDPTRTIQLTVNFEAKTGHGRVVKKDDNGNPVMGALFRFENLTTGETVEARTDENGLSDYGANANDQVRITEVEAPTGYLLSENPTATITIAAGQITEVPFVNPKMTLRTTATDKEDGDKALSPEKNVTIVDRVSYTNLYTDGREYVVTGTLMDKATGKPLTINGKAVTATKTFVPTTKDGYVDLSFTFDGSALAGKKVVAFESVSQDGKEVITHKDINDEGQTVTFDTPKIGTTAVNAADNSKAIHPEEKAVIKDTISYTNLQVGKTYQASGTLMDKATGKALLVNGKTVTATQTFVPKTANGTVDVTFTFDATQLQGKEIVVFETVSRQRATTQEWNTVTEHKDLNDKGQTVTVKVPSIGTTALNAEDGTSIFDPEAQVTLTDTIAFNNLQVGKTYRATGILMDKATGKELRIDGAVVTATTTFKPEATSGTVDVTFTFDASSLKGRTIVVFETVEREHGTLGTWYHVTDHKDINDKGQTVSITNPAIQTTASNKEDDSKLLDPLETVTIQDTVTYTGLIAGKTYKLTGTLMDKETEELILVDGEPVTVTQSFVAEKANGSVNVVFTFNASALAGKTVVVFEDLYRNTTLIATHADIEDEDQTVDFTTPEIHTTAINEDSGDHTADALEDVTITDTVEYANLINGKTYTLTGTLMNQETGLPLEINGEVVTQTVTFIAREGFAEIVTPEEDPEEDTNETDVPTTKVDAPTVEEDDTTVPVDNEIKQVNGSVDVVFTLNAKDLQGVTTVAFEELVREDTTIAVHTDIEDEGQSITFNKPTLQTTATSQGKKEVTTSTTVTIDDVVAYTGLTVGKEYRVEGVLMNKATGQPYLVNGQKVTATQTFTAETVDGTVNMTFTFNGTGITSKTDVVVFEDLYRDDLLLVSHADINDTAQTVTINPIPKPLPQTGDSGMATAAYVLLAALVFFAIAAGLYFGKKEGTN